MNIPKKGVWQLVGAALELLGSIGAIIGLVTGFIPDKKETDNEVK